MKYLFILNDPAYGNLERMLKPIAIKGEVLLCGTCMDARAMQEDENAAGTRRSSMSELTAKTADADKVLVF